MSYVLEALKKAEADRNPSTRAALVQERTERRRGRWLQWTIVGALLANLLVLAWLFVPRRDAEPRATATELPQPVATAPQPSAQPAPITATPAQTRTQVPTEASAAPADAGVLPPPPATTAPAETSERAAAQPVSPPAPPAPPPRARVALNALPADVRRRFPGLSFSTHVYAEDPELRALVVNGTRLVEGGRLGEITVEEITEEGAVLGFERYLVEVSVLETWE